MTIDAFQPQTTLIRGEGGTLNPLKHQIALSSHNFCPGLSLDFTQNFLRLYHSHCYVTRAFCCLCYGKRFRLLNIIINKILRPMEVIKKSLGSARHIGQLCDV